MKKQIGFLLAAFFFAIAGGFSQNTAPLNEGFESGGVPDDWTMLQIGGSNYFKPYSSAHTGTYSLYMTYNPYPSECMLITPQLSITEDSSTFVCWLAVENYPNMSNTFTIELSTTTPTASAFTKVLKTFVFSTWTSSLTFQKFEIDLSDYEGENVYVAFHNKTIDGNGAWVAIDDVSGVQKIVPACPKPELIISDVTPYDATVSWMGVEDVDEYNVYYKKSTETSYNEDAIEVSDNTFTFSDEDIDLVPATTYQVYVTYTCPDDELEMTGNVYSFQTPCVALTEDDLPYKYGFEDLTTSGVGVKPTCWTTLNTVNSTYPYVTGTPNTGTKSMYMYYATDFIALNGYEGDITELQLDFFARPNAATAGSIKVGVMTSLTDPTTFQLVKEISAADLTAAQYNEVIVPFDQVEFDDDDAEVFYVALQHGTTAGAWYFDDFTLEKIPDCPKVTAATVSVETTQTTAKITIDAGEDGDYEVYYRKSGTEEWSDALEAEDGVVEIEDLSAQTLYEYYVVTVCNGDDDDPTSVTFTFKTACGVLGEDDLPFTESFEANSATGSGIMPDCWTRHNTTYQQTYPYVYNSTIAKTGTKCLYSSGNTEFYSFMPYSGNIKDVQLTFYARPNGITYYYGSLQIGVMKGTDTTTFQPLQEIAAQELTSGTYNEIVVPFSSVQIDEDEDDGEDETVYRIAIHRKGSYSSYVWYLDDFTLEKIPDCPKVLYAKAAPVDTKATVTFAGKEDAEYNVYYRKSGDTDWSDAVEAEDMQAVLEDLSASTTYEYYIESVCDDEDNKESKIFTFTTTCAMIEEDDLPVTNDLENETAGSGYLPACWTRFNTYQPSYPYVYNYSTYAHSGSKVLWSYGGADFFALKGYAGNIKDIQLTFHARPQGNTTYYGSLKVGVMTNIMDTNTFVVAAEIPATDLVSGQYNEIVVPFNNLAVDENLDGYFIAIHRTGSNGYYWYLDDFTWEKIPACPKVYTSSVEVGAYDATITFGGVEGLDYQVVYRKQGTTLWSDPVDAEDFEVVLEELTPNTTYEYRIETVCEDEDENPVSSIKTFKTACDYLTEEDLPVFEGFEDFTTTGQNVRPSCWSIYHTVNTGYPYVYSAQAKTGTKSFYSNMGYEFFSLDGYQGDISKTQLDFYAKPSSSSYGSIKVGIIKNGDTNSFVSVKEIEASTLTVNAYNHITVPFSTYEDEDYEEGDVYNVALHRSGSSGTWYLDDFTFEVVPACEKVESVYAKFDVTSAEIVINNANEDYEYNVYYRKDGNTQWSDAVEAEDGVATLDDLLAGTQYEYYVESVCDEGEAKSLTFKFKTGCVLTEEDLPYKEGFEDYVSGQYIVPDCWFTHNTYMPGYPCVLTTTANTGTKAFYSLYNTDFFSIKGYNGDITELTLEFDVKVTTASAGKMQVGVMTSPSDTTTFTLIQEINAADLTLNEYNTVAVSFKDAELDEADNYYIAFHRTGATSNYAWYIDDMMLDKTSDCPKVYFTSAETTAATAQITLTDGDIEYDYSVYYRKKGETTGWSDPVESEVEDDVIIVNLEELSPNTTYEFYVETDCGGDNPESKIFTFTTACSELTEEDLPYTYGAEDMTATGSGTLPSCWTKLHVYQTNYPYVTTGYPKTGTKSIYSMYPTEFFQLQSYKGDITKLQFTFYARPNAITDYYGGLKVGVMKGTDTTTFQVLNTVSASELTAATYNEIVTSLAGYQPDEDDDENTIYTVAIHRTGNYGGYAWYFDDFTWDKLPDCAKVMNEPTVAVTAEAAIITINGIQEDVDYQVVYRKQGATDWSDAIDFEDGEAEIEDLSAQTLYEYKIITLCDEGDDVESKTWTFKTECSYLTEEDLPFFDDFESYTTTGGYPDCWAKYTTSLYPRIVHFSSLSSSWCYSGLSYINMNQSGYQATAAVLPGYKGDITELTLDFYLGHSSGNGTFSVGVTTDYNDTTKYVAAKVITTADVPSSPNAAGKQYVNFAVSFADLELDEADVYYPVVWTNGVAWLVDDVKLMKTPACPEVKSATASVTAEKAEITIEAGEDLNYELYYRKQGETSWSEEAIEFEDGVAEIENLSASTTYEYYVVVLCDEDESVESKTFTFTTSCGTVTEFPYTMGFESTESTKSACWTVSSTGSATWDKAHTAGYGESPQTPAKEGSAYAYFPFQNGSKGYLISPIMDISDLDNPYVKFWYINQTFESNVGETFEVYYREDPSDDWSLLKSYGTTIKTTWTFDSVLLKDASETYQIAFYVSSTAMWGVGLDGVEIYDNSTADVCAKPTSLAVTDITETGAKLTWSGDAESYDVKLGENGTSTNVTTASYTFTNLTSGTQYTAYVRANCEDIDDPSAWASINFTTEEETVTCDKPTALTIVDSTETTVKISWTGTASKYSVQRDNETAVEVTTNSYEFTNLTAGSTYSVKVKSICGENSESDWSDALTIKTKAATPAPCDKPTALTIVDSTETTVKISWTGTASKYSVQRDNETAVEVTTNSYEFTNLTAGSTYSVKVKSICGENSESDWSDALTIKTKAATPAPCDKPTALTIVDSTETTVKISWTGTASKYSVQRDNETAVEVTTNSYEFTNLTAGSTYSVKVKSICGENSESDWSDALTIKTKAATPAPCDKPTALTIVDSTETTVKISWTGTASKYSVQRDNETAVEVTTNSYEFTNLTAGSTYSVKVKSICGENSESDWSDALTIKTKAATPAPCDKPTALTIVDSTETTVKISWTGTASKYSVQRDNETAVEVTTNSYEFTNLTAGSTYSVKVKSICGENSESDWSDALTITTKTAEEPCEATAETIEAAICDGGMYTANGEAYTQAGTYTQTLTNACGADSVLTINLTVNPTYAETVTETIQKGESYTFNGQTYTQSGTYTVTLESEAGCDSVVTLELIVDENGLTDATGALHVSMYPNPATTQAVLSIEGLTSEAEIILSDVSGRIIRRNTLPTGQKTMTIETESLSKGTYYIRIVSEGMIRTEKLIKQ